MKILIRNGHVVDPSQGIDGIRDILIDGDRISEVREPGRTAPAAGKGTPPPPLGKGGIRRGKLHEPRVIDAAGMFVVPGLIDLHVHLREPGFEYKETIQTGTLAAVRGGFTTVCCMPNTKPVNDNAGITEFIVSKARLEGACAVLPIGAISKGQKGEELAEFTLMHQAGCVAFSDDGRPVMDSMLMRRALEYSRVLGCPVISHCEDLGLASGGVMNEGLLSVTLGLRGIPAQAEEIMVARDIALAELTGGRLHIAHVSTSGSVEIIRAAKKRGIAAVTAETCPHYFSITEEAVAEYNANAKVNPPLRRRQDLEAVRSGLADGTLDAIATDHAPHHLDEKTGEFDLAPSGISGLETALGLSMMLVKEGVLSMAQLVERMAVLPARIIGTAGGALSTGSPADLAIIDPNRQTTVNASTFASKGRNTPFDGWRLPSSVAMTICKGKIHTWE